jgi:hypothetical protein
MIRPDVYARFRRVVERAIVKADKAHAEHLARLRLGRAAEGGYRDSRPPREVASTERAGARTEAKPSP